MIHPTKLSKFRKIYLSHTLVPEVSYGSQGVDPKRKSWTTGNTSGKKGVPKVLVKGDPRL